MAHPEYAEDLSGFGAYLHGGRWNNTGYAVVYTSETASLSILERLVHIKNINGNMPYKLIEVEFPDKDMIDLSDFTDNLLKPY